MNPNNKPLTQDEHWDNNGVVRCSNCNYMSYPDSDILSELLGEPEWDTDTSARWAGVFMHIYKHEDVYHAQVSLDRSEGGWFFQETYDQVEDAKEALIKATKEKYRLMLAVDAEKQQALHMATRDMSVPDHLKDQAIMD